MALTKEDRKKRLAEVKKLISKGYSLQMLAKHFEVREENIRLFLKRNNLQTQGQKTHGDHQTDA